MLVVGHLELDLHVVRGASASHSALHICVRRRGDEVVVTARLELHPSRSGGERAEGDGEVHELVRLCALGDDPWVG